MDELFHNKRLLTGQAGPAIQELKEYLDKNQGMIGDDCPYFTSLMFSESQMNKPGVAPDVIFYGDDSITGKILGIAEVKEPELTNTEDLALERAVAAHYAEAIAGEEYISEIATEITTATKQTVFLFYERYLRTVSVSNRMFTMTLVTLKAEPIYKPYIVH